MRYPWDTHPLEPHSLRDAAIACHCWGTFLRHDEVWLPTRYRSAETQDLETANINQCILYQDHLSERTYTRLYTLFSFSPTSPIFSQPCPHNGNSFFWHAVSAQIVVWATHISVCKQRHIGYISWDTPWTTCLNISALRCGQALEFNGTANPLALRSELHCHGRLRAKRRPLQAWEKVGKHAGAAATWVKLREAYTSCPVASRLPRLDQTRHDQQHVAPCCRTVMGPKRWHHTLHQPPGDETCRGPASKHIKTTSPSLPCYPLTSCFRSWISTDHR